MSLHPSPTPIPGVFLLEGDVYEDNRGLFWESFSERDFEKAMGFPVHFVQDCEAESRRGTVRGLHWQKAPHGQAKLVRCTHGSILDVVLDIRPDSPAFGLYYAVELEAAVKQALWIPEGLAHGYMSTCALARVSYKVTSYYEPESVGRILWNDPDLAIYWPEAARIHISRTDRRAQGWKAYCASVGR